MDINVIGKLKSRLSFNDKKKEEHENKQEEQGIIEENIIDSCAVAEESPSYSKADYAFSKLSSIGGGIVPVIVFVLHDNEINIFDIVSKLPGVGIAGVAGKFLFQRILETLKNYIIEHGESYIMENLVRSWKDKGISIEELENDIIKSPDNMFTDDIKIQAVDILYSYYNKNTEYIVRNE